MNIVKPSECPTCPVCEQCKPVTENENKPVSIDDNIDSKDILLYSALGACGFLAVMVVILAFRRK